jgi:uncharacterized membrane protein YbaN (DUF454 family)
MSKFKKYLFISLGILATGLGIVGIFLPILPTTPFLLLAAILFSNSSEKFLHWLETNKLCGPYIKRYREGKGVSLKSKIIALVLLWGTISTSAIFAVPAHLWYVKILMGLVAIGVTIHLVRVPTYRPELEEPPVPLAEKDPALDHVD